MIFRKLDQNVVFQGFQDELQKIASSAAKSGAKAGRLARWGVPAAAGIALYETGRRANNDRRLGRQVRMQQGG